MSKTKHPEQEPDEVWTPTPITRTPAGLRDKLYDLWDDYSFGRIQGTRVVNFVRLAGEINKTTVTELMVRKYTLENPSAPPLFIEQEAPASKMRQ
jgi:hypothetical protein